MKRHGFTIIRGSIHVSKEFPVYDFNDAVDRLVRSMGINPDKIETFKVGDKNDFLQNVLDDIFDNYPIDIEVALFDLGRVGQFVNFRDDSSANQAAMKEYGKYLYASTIVYGLRQAYISQVRKGEN